MDVDELRYSLLIFLKTLMENRSLTQSAEELGLSQAKASRNLARLRIIFQDQLFVRTRLGMAPTAKAQELFPSVVAMIHDFERMLSSQDGGVEDFSGVVKISAVDNGAVMFITKIIAEIIAQAPRLRIEVVPLFSDLYEKIESGSIDVAIYPQAPLPADFHEAILYEDYFVCVVHKDHPLANYAKINKIPPVEEVNRYKKLEITVRGSQNRVISESVYPGMHQLIQVNTPYFFSTPYFLENKELTVILPYTTAKALTEIAPVVILPVSKPHKTYEARLIWHHRTHHNPVLRWVRQLIIEKAKASPYAPYNTQ